MGYVEGRNRVSAVAKYFEVLNYGLDSNHLIDYDALEKQALSYLPKAIVAGANVYCRTIDYQRIKKICDSINAYLLVDISDIAGLLAAKIYQSNPF